MLDHRGCAGKAGQSATAHLSLYLIADVGLIGKPNQIIDIGWGQLHGCSGCPDALFVMELFEWLLAQSK